MVVVLSIDQLNFSHSLLSQNIDPDAIAFEKHRREYLEVRFEITLVDHFIEQ